MAKSNGQTPANPTPHLSALADEVWEDLDPEHFGLKWMKGDSAVRILLSDHLAGALESVGSNLNDAAYHLSAFETASSAVERATLVHLRRNWQKGEPLELSPSLTKRIDRHYLEFDTNISVFFRATGGSMDNLGVVIAIIGALPVELVQTFTWRQLWAPDANGKSSSTSAEQDGLREWVRLAGQAAGPPGWLDWTLDLREMVVHRPRRIWLTRIIADPNRDGRPLRAHHHLMLPREPGLTNIEIMREGGDLAGALLSEPAQTTMAGVIDSTRRLVDACCAYLLSLYERRRAEPSLLQQPSSQWRMGSITPRRHAQPFVGYEVGSVDPPSIEDSKHLHPALGERLQAGAVANDEARAQWPDWLAEAEESRAGSPPP